MFVNSCKIAHAERHVTTKNHIREQQYHFMKQQRLKSLEVAAIFFPILESLLLHEKVLLLFDVTFGLDMPLSVSNSVRVDSSSAILALEYASFTYELQALSSKLL